MASGGLNASNNAKEKDKKELSKNMEFYLKEMAQRKNIYQNIDTMDLTNVIVKDINMDRKYHLITVARRLMYCCPLPIEEIPSTPPPSPPI